VIAVVDHPEFASTARQQRSTKPAMTITMTIKITSMMKEA